MPPLYRLPALILAAHDGDSLVARIDLPLSVSVTRHVRLMGIDTPELVNADPELKAKAFKARDRLASLTVGVAGCFVETAGKGDKYGRLLARVLMPNHETGAETCVNDLLVNEGLAVSYNGGKR